LKSELERKDIPVGLLDLQEINPNAMDDAGFNLLCDNMEKVGFIDPVYVREMDGRYRIIGGAHRFEAGKLLGYTEIPCTIADGEMDDDLERFEITRMNVIRGKMDAGKFMELYQSLSTDYSTEVAAEMFGFTDEREFEKLIGQTAKLVPQEMQLQFTEAAKELKTLDQLSALLNKMLSEYGDSLPFGYMVVDFGGRDSLWLRMRPGDKDNFLALAGACKDASVTVDSAMRLLVKGLMGSEDSVSALLEDCEKVVFTGDIAIPTEENIAQLANATALLE
jgi:hypothetical protein